MNLRCGGCANTITTKLEVLEGVEAVQVNIEKSEVIVNHLENMTQDIIIDRLKELGYPLEGEENGAMSKVKSLKSCMVGKLS